MTGKQLINYLCYEYNTKNYNEERLKAAQEIKKELEISEIIKKNPELVLWCCCYENATQMILDRRSFKLKDNVNEIIENFNKVKEWLENDK